MAWFCKSFAVAVEIHVQVVCHFLRQCLATSSFERSFQHVFLTRNSHALFVITVVFNFLISSLNSVCWAKASSASVIFHISSHSDFTLCFFDLSIKILALWSWTTLTIGKHLFRLFPVLLVQHLSSSGRTSIFSLPSRINVFACCWHCSFACSFFTGSWVPSLAVFSVSFTSVPIRVLPLTSWLTDALSLFLCRLLLFRAGPWFRLVRFSRARWLLLA